MKPCLFPPAVFWSCHTSDGSFHAWLDLASCHVTQNATLTWCYLGHIYHVLMDYGFMHARPDYPIRFCCLVTITADWMKWSLKYDQLVGLKLWTLTVFESPWHWHGPDFSKKLSSNWVAHALNYRWTLSKLHRLLRVELVLKLVYVKYKVCTSVEKLGHDPVSAPIHDNFDFSKWATLVYFRYSTAGIPMGKPFY